MNDNTSQKHDLSQEINALIAIPCYNNRATLYGVVEEALTLGLPVLVVNDGSTDGGPDTLAALPISLIHLPTNTGKGAALLAAAEWAEKRNFTHLITLDADGQHIPKEAKLFLERIKTSPWSILVGHRDFSRAMVPFSSRFGRKFSNFWLGLSTGYGHIDSQCGFRAYPVAALRRLKIRSRHYDFEVEILIRSAWAGLSLETVNISVRYTRESMKASHFDSLRDNLRISRVYFFSVIKNLLPLPQKILFPEGKKPEETLSIKHPFRAVKMLLRERTTPREIVLACMLGIFLATMPMLGFHSITIIFFATRLRLNRLIALNISHLCAPPFVPALGIELGYFIRNGRFLTEFDMQTLWHEAPQRLVDYLIGSIVLAPFLALFVGAIIYMLILAYQKISHKRKRLDLN